MLQYDILAVERAILLAFLRDPSLVRQFSIRKPRYADNCMTTEQVEECLMILARQHIPDLYARIDGRDEQGNHYCALGTCGHVLFVESSQGSACIDVDDTLVEGASYFAQ
jgi:hypothetical protein